VVALDEEVGREKKKESDQEGATTGKEKKKQGQRAKSGA